MSGCSDAATVAEREGRSLEVVVSIQALRQAEARSPDRADWAMFRIRG